MVRPAASTLFAGGRSRARRGSSDVAAATRAHVRVTVTDAGAFRRHDYELEDTLTGFLDLRASHLDIVRVEGRRALRFIMRDELADPSAAGGVSLWEPSMGNGSSHVNTAADRGRANDSVVRALTAADARGAGSVLALAFESDPHMQWIFRDASRRLGRLQRMWTTLLERTWLERANCYVLERHAGACVWLPPDGWQLSLAAQAQLLAPLAGAVRDALPRLVRAHSFNAHKHPHRPAHWYLATIGVAPALQCRAYGQALLEPGLRRCERDGVGAYLEASSPRNRAFYERNGFEVIEQCTYVGGALTTWRMWREPVLSSSHRPAA